MVISTEMTPQQMAEYYKYARDTKHMIMQVDRLTRIAQGTLNQLNLKFTLDCHRKPLLGAANDLIKVSEIIGEWLVKHGGMGQ